MRSREVQTFLKINQEFEDNCLSLWSDLSLLISYIVKYTNGSDQIRPGGSHVVTNRMNGPNAPIVCFFLGIGVESCIESGSSALVLEVVLGV